MLNLAVSLNNVQGNSLFNEQGSLPVGAASEAPSPHHLETCTFPSASSSFHADPALLYWKRMLAQVEVVARVL
jgi:hypothetical protein